MSNYPLLQEMPQDITQLDYHSLNNKTTNEKLYKKLSAIKYKKHIMTVFDKAYLYKEGANFFCLDDKLQRVTYYMTYNVTSVSKLGRSVWQTLVWADPLASYISGIPQKIFFDHLLTKFDTILTDSQQTWDGKRFWKLRIADAFEKNLNVFFYNFANHELIKINNRDDLEAYTNLKDIWGPSNLHKMKRIVISSKDLLPE